MFAKNPSESFVDLCDWLNNAVVWKKKKCPSQRGLIVEQQSESEHWIFKAITEPSHINWEKKAHLVCPEQRSQRCTVPSFESAVTEYYRSWFRSDARPFLATFLLLTAVNQKHTNIYLDICHAMRADVSESWLGVTFFLPTADEIADKCLDSTNTFAKHPFFLMITIQADSWQEKRSIPSCRALIWRSTCCLWTHGLRCSLNSTAFQAESAQPGDHPLWDQSTAREGIWGARLSGLWGVIPQINMEIMCKACVPIMLSHFFSKISWNLCEALHNV